MLTNLLPGLRTLRTPLAVGYLWLLGLWLIFHDLVPTTKPKDSGPVQSIFQLGSFVGNSAVLAAISFVAYLLGIMVLLSIDWNVFMIMYPPLSTNPLRGKNFWFSRLNTSLSRPLLAPYKPASRALQAQLSLVLVKKIRSLPDEYQDNASTFIFGQVSSIKPYSPKSDEDVSYGKAAAIIAPELPAVSIQLQAKNRDLWDTFDRAKAESEFRSAIAWPIGLIILIVSVQSY